jgi:hypothetical protein
MPRETFCGFASVEAVREKLTRLQAGILLTHSANFVAWK